MSKINDGGPAFPAMNPQWTSLNGMSLRDWFAGHADVSKIEFPDFATAAKWIGCDAPNPSDFVACLEFAIRAQAFIRYRAADAMLLARSNRGEEDNG